MAPGLLSFLTALALWIVADRGYASHAFRTLIWDLGARPAIPAKRNEAAVACPPSDFRGPPQDAMVPWRL